MSPRLYGVRPGPGMQARPDLLEKVNQTDDTILRWIMATVALTKETFNETIADNDTVIIDFWAEWCGPCKSFAPTYEDASEQHDDIVFAKVDTEEQQELTQAFGIQSIPTLMVFRDQILLYNEAGALPSPVLDDLIGQVKDLDMDDVRQQIAEQDGGEES